MVVRICCAREAVDWRLEALEKKGLGIGGWGLGRIWRFWCGFGAFLEGIRGFVASGGFLVAFAGLVWTR